MNRFVAKIRALVSRSRAEAELDREVAAHLALLEEKFLGEGLDPVEARRAARRAYGSVEAAKQLHREERGVRWVEQCWQDVWQAARALAKSPGFTLVALASLAFGIGVNTAIFTLVNGVLLQRLPVPDPERIVQVEAELEHFEFAPNFFSFPAFRQLRQQTEIFEDAIAFGQLPGAVVEAEGGEPADVTVDFVSGSYFSFFSAKPAVGRLLGESDDAVEGASQVCVLSYAAWQSMFHGDADAVNQTIRINGVPALVVGVADQAFTGPELQRQAGVWIPTAMRSSFGGSREEGNFIWLHVLGRLRPGLSVETAGARLEAVSKAIEAALPADRANADATYHVRDASRGFDTWRTKLRDPLLILMGAVGLVLLISCANLANLLLARASHRGPEFAVKLALGISRWRLMRQLLAETLMLAGSGGVVALGVSAALTRVLLTIFNQGQQEQTLNVQPDSWVLVFTLSCCVLTALVAGLYPAWRSGDADLAREMGSGERTIGRGRLLRRGLIVAQVTLTLALVYAAGLFGHSLGNLRAIDTGYQVDGVLGVDLVPRRPSSVPPRERQPAEMDAVLARLRGIPGVESATYSYPGVLTGWMIGTGIRVPAAKGGEQVSVVLLFAGAEYFSTLGIPVLQGRAFTTADRAGTAPVVVINQRLAREGWGGRNPIGDLIPVGRGSEESEATIVGVVGNSKYQNVREEPKPILYLPILQSPSASATLHLRCRGGCGAIGGQVRNFVRTGAPHFQISKIRTLEGIRDSQLAQERLMAFLSRLFGLLGGALALVGIYGLISYAVARRTREVGIRVALGARRGGVLRLFVGEAMVLVGAGVAVGLPLALGLARYVQSLLYEVNATEPADIARTVVLLVAGGLAAAWIPAWRATRIHPLDALRQE